MTPETHTRGVTWRECTFVPWIWNGVPGDARKREKHNSNLLTWGFFASERSVWRWWQFYLTSYYSLKCSSSWFLRDWELGLLLQANLHKRKIVQQSKRKRTNNHHPPEQQEYREEEVLLYNLLQKWSAAIITPGCTFCITVRVMLNTPFSGKGAENLSFHVFLCISPSDDFSGLITSSHRMPAI